MENIQLRWLNKSTGKTIMDQWGYYQPEKALVLQWRSKYNETDYSESRDFGSGEPRTSLKWTEWVDVEVVDEGVK